MQKIIPCLWFDGNVEEAVNLYTSIIKNSKIGTTMRYTEEMSKGSGMPAGTILTIEFSLNGQDFLALNGGPIFKPTEANSYIINCEDQTEIDMLWEKLTANGGQESQCGWLKDKFGFSWQIVPKDMNKLISHPKAAAAMMEMHKIDIQKLKDAAS